MSREEASYLPRRISLAGDGMQVSVPQHIPVAEWLSLESFRTSAEELARKLAYPQCCTSDLERMRCNSRRQEQILVHSNQSTKEIENNRFILSKQAQRSEHPQTLTKDIQSSPSVPSRHAAVVGHPQHLTEDIKSTSFIPMRRTQLVAHPLCLTDTIRSSTSTPSRYEQVLVHPQCLTENVESSSSTQSRPDHVFLHPQCLTEVIRNSPSTSNRYTGEFLHPQCLTENVGSLPYTPSRRADVSAYQHLTNDIESPSSTSSKRPDVSTYAHLTKDVKSPSSTSSRCSPVLVHPQCYTDDVERATSTPNRCTYLLVSPEHVPGYIERAHSSPEKCVASPVKGLPFCFDDKYKDPTSSNKGLRVLETPSRGMGDRETTRLTPSKHIYTPASLLSCSGDRERARTLSKKSLQLMDRVEDSQALPQSYKDSDTSYKSESEVLIQSVEKEIATENEGDEENDLMDQDSIDLINVLIHIPENELTLADLIQICGPYTSDKAQFLTEVMDEELNTFYDFAKKMYEKKASDVEDILAAQKLSLRNRYKQWIVLMEQRKCRVLNELNKLVPDFDWDMYTSDKFYLHNYFFLENEKYIKYEDVSQKEDQQEFCHKTLHHIHHVEDELSQVQEEGELLSNILNEMRENNLDRMAEQEDIMCYKTIKGKKLMKRLHQLHLEHRKAKDEFKVEWHRQNGASNCDTIEYQEKEDQN